MGARLRPTSSGVRVLRVTVPLRTSATWLGPEMESSSRPLPSAGVAVDDEGVAGAEQGHGFGDERDEVRGVDAHDLGGGSGGVGERAEEIEDGADAEGAADGHDGLHGRMQRWRVEEGEAMFAEELRRRPAGERSTGMPRASRTSAEPHCEVTARLPCLADGGSGGCGDEGGGGGDVEGAAGIAAGAAGVDELSVVRRR